MSSTHDSDKISNEKALSFKDGSDSGVIAPALVNTDIEAAARRAQFKFDWIVLPFVTIFYFLNFLDRSNIGNARTSGMQKALHITDHQYSIALTITYIPYIIAEIPSNLVLKKFGAHRLLPIYVMSWGLVSTMQGFMTSYGGLLACRFFLGLCEGGLLPGIVLYMSAFYRRHALQTRVTVLFTATSLAGAFSGLLAYGIVHMDGVGGKAGWSWIFFLEGIVTVLFGIFSVFFMPENVSKAKFLTEEERNAVNYVLKQDWVADEDHEPFLWSEVLSTFKAPQVMILVPAFFLQGTTLFGLAYFVPTIVKGLGFSTVRTQLMTVPPYAASFVVSLLLAIASDKYRSRGVPTILASLIAVAGFAMFLGSHNKTTLYGSLFLQITGVYVSCPTLSAWNANNVMPHYRRGTSVGLTYLMVSCGGILSTWIFPSTEGPRYRKATIINLTFSLGIAIFSIINMFWLYAQNQKRRREKEALALQGGSHIDEEAEKKRLGDRHRDFVYTL